MALPVSIQLRYWGIGFVVFILLLWVLGDVLLPFITGMAIAYFLDPTADRLEKWGVSRVWATIIITVVCLVVALPLLIVLTRELVQQLGALIEAAPMFLEQFRVFLIDTFPSILDEESAIRNAIESVISTLQSSSGTIANIVLSSAFSVLDAVVFLVVAPVVAFYMLMDWDRMIAAIDGWLPRDHKQTIRALAKELDMTMAGFVRGQLSVCGILGAFYAIALMLVGLQFGLIVGIIAGLLTFIPYVGSVIGGALSIGLAIFQFWGQPEWIAVVAVIFVIGQMVEGNYLTPKLVGGSVGLHPVWLLFALSAFGSLFGFTGMLVAVPVAACIGVFTRFGLQQYLGGKLYRGLTDNTDG
ncbi:MAG: AI-2E family transporter [Pseudomonadota bacterium]